MPSEKPILDVRSPAEYKQGHIPGAISFPLFTDAERAEVGTLYKRVSPNAALLRGLDIVGSKMAKMVKDAQKIAPAGELTVYCWRGGKRSGSVSWLLRLAGMQVETLPGGYKQYRRGALDLLEACPYRFIVLSGRTGCGKTEVLKELAHQTQVIDLEGLANHRGSAFGAIGQDEQPTSEQFELLIAKALLKMDPSKPIWVEDESRNIGKLPIPQGLWTQMRQSPVAKIEISAEARMKLILGQYSHHGTELLKEAFLRLSKRLAERTPVALLAVEAGDLEQAAAIAFKYYDKAYDFSWAKTPRKLLKSYNFEHFDEKIIAKELLLLEHSIE
jgi:tRNA 2-selenouridine synthase